MATLDYPHITRAPDDVARLERLPRIRVAQIAADHVGNGWSAEEIIRQYPHLTAAEVHAALGYYFDHREELDAELSAEIAHFAPVASEAVIKNRREAIMPPQARNAQVLPSVIDGALGTKLLSELKSLMLDCHKPGWDGYGAEAVSMAAYRAAENFIQSLPIGIPQPELSADPDGCVTFEWRKSPRRTLLVSVRPDGGADYAALMGVAKAHGSEPFTDSLSETLKNFIHQVIGA